MTSQDHIFSGSLTCNDLSGSRILRLLNILQMYVPKEKQNQVIVTTKNGLAYNQPNFDKVCICTIHKRCNLQINIVIYAIHFPLYQYLAIG